LRRTSLNPKLLAHIEHYSQAHRTPWNKALHFVGIPIIAIGLFGLLSQISLRIGAPRAAFEPNLGWIVLLVFAVHYVCWDWRAAIGPIVALSLCYACGSELSAWILAPMLLVGVVLHVIGHFRFEHKPPSLLSAPVAVIEAPAWLLAVWLGWKPASPGSQVPGEPSIPS
jgi:uncharacterized membrane protein YGL010W